MLRIPNRQNPRPQRYHTEFSVQKIPIREKQLPNSFTAEYFHKGVM